MHRGQVPIELSKAFTPHQDLWISQKSGLSGTALHSPRSPFWKSHPNISAQECALQLPVVSPVTSLWAPLQVSYTLCFLAFFAVRRIYTEKSWSYRKMAWGCLTQKTSMYCAYKVIDLHQSTALWLRLGAKEDSPWGSLLDMFAFSLCLTTFS